MKKTYISILVFCQCIVANAANPVASTVVQSDQIDQLIIKYKDGHQSVSNNDLSKLSKRGRINLAFHRRMSGGAIVFKLPKSKPHFEAKALSQQLASDPAIDYVEPNIKFLPVLSPSDTYINQQWGVQNSLAGINAVQAWEISTGNTNQVVAVVDTGIRPHPDFGNRILAGYDFISDTATANDGDGRDSNASDPGDWCGTQNSSWHGTHVAGILAATGNNAVGIAGVNWQTKILPVRVLGRCGGYLSDVADGIRWSAGVSVAGVPANPNPAAVINLSLGGGSATCSYTSQNAINAAIAAGSVVVVAAGNSNTNVSNQDPANCSGIVSVAATDSNGSKASFSNYGSTITIAAPGVSILSTLNSGLTTPGIDSYAYYSGTSMATPFVAGVVSLMLSVKPALKTNQTELFTVLRQSAQAFPNSSCTIALCGAGIVNAQSALNILTSPTPTPTPTVINPNMAIIPVIQNLLLDE